MILLIPLVSQATPTAFRLNQNASRVNRNASYLNRNTFPFTPLTVGLKGNTICLTKIF